MKVCAKIFVIIITCTLLGGCQKQMSTTLPASNSMQPTKPRQTPMPRISKDKLVTTKSGLQYEDVAVGTGAAIKKGDVVGMDYTGWLKNGAVFDTSIGIEPMVFRPGMGDVIKAWDEGVASMKVGGKRILIVPPKLAHGYDPMPGGWSPANVTLIFEIELKETV